MLNQSENTRYQKHIFLPEIGNEGQLKLKNAKVLVVGAGGLGCPVLQYLAAAGIGTIGIIDGDKVELSNLQRQILFNENDIGFLKAEKAAQHLCQLNNELDYNVFTNFLAKDNAIAILEKYDIVVDCTDNFEVRYLINDVCVQQKKPFVYGAIHKFEGQISVFNYMDKNGILGPTYRCVFPDKPSATEIPNCATVGVLGILPGTIGLYQANEVIKMILGIGKVLTGELLLIDLLENTTQKIKIKRATNAIVMADEGFRLMQTNNTSKPMLKEISVFELKQMFDEKADIQLIDVRLEFEYGICNLPNAQLIPLNDIENKLNQISKSKPVVFYCHHGMRSAHAINTLLKMEHFDNLYNLVGGIDQWAQSIDIEMDRY
jgi:sulfur-carrier protein adenylyltransferase/sulfurtransferase